MSNYELLDTFDTYKVRNITTNTLEATRPYRSTMIAHATKNIPVQKYRYLLSQFKEGKFKSETYEEYLLQILAVNPSFMGFGKNFFINMLKMVDLEVFTMQRGVERLTSMYCMLAMRYRNNKEAHNMLMKILEASFQLSNASSFRKLASVSLEDGSDIHILNLLEEPTDTTLPNYCSLPEFSINDIDYYLLRKCLNLGGVNPVQVYLNKDLLRQAVVKEDLPAEVKKLVTQTLKERYLNHYEYSYLGNKNYVNSRRLQLLIDALSYKELDKLLEAFINFRRKTERLIDIHDFLENLSKGFFDNIVTGNIVGPLGSVMEELYKVAPSIDNMYKFLKYANYRFLYDSSKTIQEKLDHIGVIEGARALRGVTKELGVANKMVEGKMLFHPVLVDNELVDPKYKEIFYSKNPVLVNKIGNLTHCCFTPNGMARSLVGIARTSPLAGILTGRDSAKRTTWFSFVWEQIRQEPDTGLFYPVLVLDNVEAENLLTVDFFTKVIERLKEDSDYHHVVLGTSRNDINRMDFMKDSYRKTETIPLYDKQFARYGYDDSLNLYDVYTTPFSDTVDELIVERATSGWFDRVAGAERKVWGSNSDPDLKSIATDKAPSYVIRTSDNRIVGYVITRLVQLDVADQEVDYRYTRKKPSAIRDIVTEPVLLFEDIYLRKSKKVMKAFQYIVEDIKHYIRDNEILYSAASCNTLSAPFIKRLKEMTAFIEDTRFGQRAEDRIKPTEVTPLGLLGLRAPEDKKLDDLLRNARVVNNL